MSKQEFLNDYKPYVDKFGMVGNNPVDEDKNVTSGNNNLYTSYFLLAAKENGFLDDEMKEEFKRIYGNNERVPGLLMRTPTNEFGHNAHDDLIGASLSSSLIDNGTLANRIYDYGVKEGAVGLDLSSDNEDKVALSKFLYPILRIFTLGKPIKYVWNNINPNKFFVSSWLLRRFDVIAALQLVGTKKTSLFGYAYLTYTFLTTVFNSKDNRHNSYIHPYVMAMAIKDINWYTRLISKVPVHMVKKDWGNFGELLGAYFNNLEHPNRKWLK